MLRTGDLVDDRFRIEKQIGAGGMGVVYRAHDEQTREPVALKLIQTNTAEEVVRATREIETLARLDHPGIVRHIKDGLTSGDQLYLAMAWIDGVTVFERMHRQGFTLREVVVLGAAVAGGLAGAHAANVLHRDIKPTNIMLEHGDPARAKLIDFGLARVAGPSHKSITLTGTTIGTPGYMSPEQARGVRALGPASDIFNLGLLLYECATGRAAFHGANLAAMLLHVAYGRPVPLCLLRPDAPAELDAIVERMLAKDPRERPADGAAALAELAQLAPLASDEARESLGLFNLPTRRDAIAAAAAAAEAAPAHCLVLAARGFIDEIVEPPLPAELAYIEAAATAAGTPLDVLVNGTLAAHFVGEPRDVAHRAADFALDIDEVLAKWTFAISTTHADLANAADAGAALLVRATKATMFARTRPPAGISIDPHTAQLVEDAFVVTPGSPPRLVSRRA